ncbi:DUF2975 domain-containing protein [Flavobacterium sp. LS2P90]|uniref:DUF2975 domain-containing protein n=1 Tax=Flavobacterium xylosi TaxID=3230415 RepID=A0ABW6HUZ4_9FLAO
MRKDNKLVRVIYIISRLGYRFTQLFILSAIFFEFFTLNGEIGNFTTSAHNSKGYPIKARIQLNIPDTLIIYKSNFSSSAGVISKTDYKKYNKDFNKIKKDNRLDKTFQINNFAIYKDGFNDVSKEIDNVKIQDQDSEINIVINPKDVFFKSILMLKSYLALALLLFIAYQCMHLFKQLNKNFVFDKQLNRRIQNIGFSLILFQAVKMIVSIISMQYLSRIDYHHYIPSIDNSDFRFMNLQIEVEYNLETLFLGLCLVVLAKLLGYGYNLQNENELTI